MASRNPEYLGISLILKSTPALSTPYKKMANEQDLSRLLGNLGRVLFSFGLVVVFTSGCALNKNYSRQELESSMLYKDGGRVDELVKELTAFSELSHTADASSCGEKILDDFFGESRIPQLPTLLVVYGATRTAQDVQYLPDAKQFGFGSCAVDSPGTEVNVRYMNMALLQNGREKKDLEDEGYVWVYIFSLQPMAASTVQPSLTGPYDAVSNTGSAYNVMVKMEGLNYATSQNSVDVIGTLTKMAFGQGFSDVMNTNSDAEQSGFLSLTPVADSLGSTTCFYVAHYKFTLLPDSVNRIQIEPAATLPLSLTFSAQVSTSLSVSSTTNTFMSDTSTVVSVSGTTIASLTTTVMTALTVGGPISVIDSHSDIRTFDECGGVSETATTASVKVGSTAALDASGDNGAFPFALQTFANYTPARLGAGIGVIWGPVNGKNLLPSPSVNIYAYLPWWSEEDHWYPIPFWQKQRPALVLGVPILYGQAAPTLQQCYLGIRLCWPDASNDLGRIGEIVGVRQGNISPDFIKDCFVIFGVDYRL